MHFDTQTQTVHLKMDASTNTSASIADRILISELFCYIQNKMTNTSHDFVIKTVTEFYRKEEINAAKIMLFAECNTTIRKKTYNIDAARLDCQDIITVLNEAGLNCPTFVCKNVAKLPIATADAFDLAKISKDISDVLKIEESVTSSFATLTCLQMDFQSVLDKCKKIDDLAEQTSCIKAMIERKNARRIILSDSTDSVSVSLTDADGDSVFEGDNLHSTISSDAEEVGPPDPDPVPEVEKVDIDLRPLPGIATGTPAHDTGTMKPARETVPKKHKVKTTDVLRLRDGPKVKDSWLDSDGFTRIGTTGKPIRETYSEKLKKHKLVFTNSSRPNTKLNVQLNPVKPKLRHSNNNGYTRRNEQCAVFVSRLDPSTSTRFVMSFLKSKYHKNFKVEQLKTKYDGYASFKVFAPIYMKEQLVDKYNWDDAGNIYVREFISKRTLY